MEQAMHNEQKKEQKSLPFFGIPRLFPYLKKYRKTLTFMVICGLLATGVDILMPVLQRYALNHFIAEKTLDTLPWYILIYVALIIFASCVNFGVLTWSDFTSSDALYSLVFALYLPKIT